MPTLSHIRRAFRSPLVSARAFKMSLRREELWRVELRGEPLPIQCLSGTVWITREDSEDDVLLSAGKECKLNGHGLALVSAMSDAEVCVGS